MTDLSKTISTIVTKLSSLPVAYIVAVISVPLTFFGWLLQRYIQHRTARRSTLMRLRSNLAFLEAALSRAATPDGQEAIDVYSPGVLRKITDEDTALHTILSRAQLDLLFELIVGIEVELEAFRKLPAGSDTPKQRRNPDVGLGLVRAARSLIGDHRPLLDERTLHSATTWRTWSYAVLWTSLLFFAAMVCVMALRFPWKLTFVLGGCVLWYQVKVGAFKPKMLQSRLERARSLALGMAVFAALVGISWIFASVALFTRIESLGQSRGDNLTVLTVLAVYGLAFIGMLAYGTRYCLRRSTHALTAAAVARATNNDGACKLEVEMPDTSTSTACRCRGFTCLREAAGIRWTTLQI